MPESDRAMRAFRLVPGKIVNGVFLNQQWHAVNASRSPIKEVDGKWGYVIASTQDGQPLVLKFNTRVTVEK